MKTFFLLFALLTSNSANALVDASPPRRATWERLLNSHFDISERGQIVDLATTFPLFFGFRFVCRFKSAGKVSAPVAVLPGEWLQAPNGGILHCPDSYDLTLENNTRLRVMQAGSTPRFIFESGSGSIVFHNESFILETPSFETSIVGRGTLQSITVAASPTEQSLFCDIGVVAMDYFPKESGGKQLFSSRDCLLEISINGSAIKRYVAGGDRIDPSNLLVPRRFWSMDTSTLAPGAMPVVNGLQVYPNYRKASNYFWNYNRTLSAANPNLHCIAYGQRSEAEAYSAVTIFQVKFLGGQFDLDPSFESGYFTLVCESATETLASKSLEVKPPEAIQTPAPVEMKKPGSK